MAPSGENALCGGPAAWQHACQVMNRSLLNFCLRHLHLPTLLIAISLGCSAPLILQAADPVSTGSNTHCVMSYNLRYASSRPPNTWPERRPLMRQLIQKISPDLIGTQEGLFQGIVTFNNFRAVPQNNLRIDWILVRGPVSMDAEEVVTFSRDGHFPSDHCPLVAWLRPGE